MCVSCNIKSILYNQIQFSSDSNFIFHNAQCMTQCCLYLQHKNEFNSSKAKKIILLEIKQTQAIYEMI